MERRRFSAALQGQNLRFTGAGEGGSARARVGFLLLEHFSLPAFTQALDTLVTANLIRSESFAVSNFSLSGEPVTSDLGLLICPDLALASAALQGLDLLVVCGGLRTPCARPPRCGKRCRTWRRAASPWPGCGTVPGSSATPACWMATAAASIPSTAPPSPRSPATAR